MAALISQLGIDKLSVADRLTLIDQIWESLDAEDGTFVLPDHKKGVRERLDPGETQPDDSLALAQLRARLKTMS